MRHKPKREKEELFYHKLSFMSDKSKAVKSMIEMGKKSKEILDSKLEELKSAIHQFYPEQVASILAYYSFVLPLSEDEIAEDPFLPAYTEFVQALTLQSPLEKYNYDPILGHHIEHLMELARATFKADLWGSYENLKKDQDTVEDSRKYVQEYIRTRTKVERDWAYPFQINSISQELFNPMNEEFSNIFKVSIHDLLEAFVGIEKLMTLRIKEHTEIMRPVLTARNWKEADNAYQTQVLGIRSSFRDKESTFKKHGIKSKQQKLDSIIGMVSSHHDLKLPELFTLNQSDIASPEIWKVLKLLSISFGDLSKNDTSHFFMKNPILKKPFILTDGNKLMIPCFWILFQNPIEIIEGLIGQHKLLENYYLNKRTKGNFLEKATFNLINNNFPTATLITNSVVRDSTGKTITENDILVLLDQVAILIECKSAEISDSSKRGSLPSFEKYLSKNVSYAYQQLDSFSAHLQLHKGKTRLKTTSNRRFNEFDTSRIRKWIKLIVTLKPMGFLSAHTPTLKAANLLKNRGDDTISVISLPDLEVVMNILTTQAHKIHYLQKRIELEANFTYVGDELDLLALYLKTGFNVPNDPKVELVISDLSSALHRYYSAGHLLNDSDERPIIKISSYWTDIITALQNRKIQGWSMITSYLLNIPYDGQIEIEKGITSLKRNPLGHKKCNYGYYRYHFINVDYIVLVFIHNAFSIEERDDTIHSILFDLKIETGTLEYVVIGFDLGKNNYPYGLIAYFSYDS